MYLPTGKAKDHNFDCRKLSESETLVQNSLPSKPCFREQAS